MEWDTTPCKHAKIRQNPADVGNIAQGPFLMTFFLSQFKCSPSRHDSWAVVACAKFCRDLMASYWITARWSFRWIWMASKKKNANKMGPASPTRIQFWHLYWEGINKPLEEHLIWHRPTSSIVEGYIYIIFSYRVKTFSLSTHSPDILCQYLAHITTISNKFWGLSHQEHSMLKSMLVILGFRTWLLIGWQVSN